MTAVDLAPRATDPYLRIMQRRILVVEDDSDLAENLSEVLTGQGYAVTVTGSTAGALSLARAAHFDVVMSDLTLPDVDGVQLLKELKQAGCTAAFVLASAYPEEERVAEAKRLGARAVLVKPVHVPELLSLLDECLS